MTTDLTALIDPLLSTARESKRGRATHPVIQGERQRVMLIALLAGEALGEHNSPPAATVQVLRGRATVHSATDSVELAAGEIGPIPPERHDLAAIEDSVVLLTVALDPPA